MEDVRKAGVLSGSDGVREQILCHVESQEVMLWNFSERMLVLVCIQGAAQEENEIWSSFYFFGYDQRMSPS